LATYTPFEKVHEFVLEKLQDSDVCIGKKGSYIKVFQSALHYKINDMPKAKSGRNYFELNALIHWSYFLFLWLKNFGKTRISLKKHVVLDGGRFDVQTGKSLFFDKLIDRLGKSSTTHISRKSFSPSTYDYTLDQAENTFCFPRGSFFEQWSDVRAVYHRAKNSGRFNQEELDYLGACLHSFIIRYGKTFALFKNQNVEAVFFIVHYLNEGFISALNDLNIYCIELQHGLISNADLYYVYDQRYQPFIKRAFFPDFLWLYGSLWKNRLMGGLEYDKEKLIVAGDYTHLFQDASNSSSEKENLILICTQKFLAADFFPWIDQVLTHLPLHPNWRVIIKLHPRERPEDIARYLKYESENVHVEINGSLDEIFKKAKIQLSIYSTTFYDAAGYNVANFALVDAITHATYIREMIDEAVAHPISFNQDPIALFHSLPQGGMLERKIIYDSFPTSEVESWFKNHLNR
jgi:hypothetical protein